MKNQAMPFRCLRLNRMRCQKVWWNKIKSMQASEVEKELFLLLKINDNASKEMEAKKIWTKICWHLNTVEWSKLLSRWKCVAGIDCDIFATVKLITLSSATNQSNIFLWFLSLRWECGYRNEIKIKWKEIVRWMQWSWQYTQNIDYRSGFKSISLFASYFTCFWGLNLLFFNHFIYRVWAPSICYEVVTNKPWAIDFYTQISAFFIQCIWTDR